MSITSVLNFWIKRVVLCFTLCFFSICYSRAQVVTHTELSSCDREIEVDWIQERIIRKVLNNDTLFLTIGIIANCDVLPAPISSLRNDTLFLSINNISQAIAMCNCCFELDMQISKMTDTNFVLIVDGKKLTQASNKRIKLPDEYEINKRGPINQSNENNEKFGLWLTYFEHSKKIKIEEYYSSEWNGDNLVWYKYFDKKGKLDYVGIRKSQKENFILIEAVDYYRLLNGSAK